jgi:hypothetical protein
MVSRRPINTQDARFLDTAQRCADFYIERTPAHGVPLTCAWRAEQIAIVVGLIPKSDDEFDQCAALARQLLEVALKARKSR